MTKKQTLLRLRNAEEFDIGESIFTKEFIVFKKLVKDAIGIDVELLAKDENYVSFWTNDLDYLYREDVDKLIKNKIYVRALCWCNNKPYIQFGMKHTNFIELGEKNWIQ